MINSDRSDSAPAFPSGKTIRRGLLIATSLSLLFLVATAYTSAATLLDRIDSTDVMRAANDGVWSGRIAAQMAFFGFAQIVLHVAFGALAWLLACASATFWQPARVKFGRIVVGWFCLLAGATIAYNALWYPRTLIGAHYYDSMVAAIGPLRVGQVIYLSVVAASGLTLLVAAWCVLQRSGLGRRKRWFTATFSVVTLACTAMLACRVGSASVDPTVVHRPNVIILGIDSLRLDHLQRFGASEGNTPHLDRFLEDADIVRDTTTPAARTFSSWVAILTGRSPPVTGARNNLTHRDTVLANPTIADVLRSAGYRTVYSTDEVRFANIDESYGFDQLITPPIGASDFLIGTYNELPVASVVVNTRLGQLLFPFSHGNRGVATMFQPKTYLGRIDRELDFRRPTLFIAHLTASHWPYYTSETPFGVSVKQHPNDRPMYRIGLRTADSMFGQLIEILRRKGGLDNAIVVVLSDHGEALALPSDSIFQSGSIVDGLGAPLKMLDIGHGQSVLSPIQYKVLLGFKAFGHSRSFAATGRELPVTATVEDIAPTILDLLQIPGDSLFADGESIASLLRSNEMPVPADAPERVRFTETDLGVLPGPDGSVDEIGTAKANSKFFEIEQSTGRLSIRDRFRPLALAYKERAAFTSRHLLAAIPAGPDTHQYLHFDLTTGDGRLLLERPGADLPEVRRLWDALETHYPGELKPATRVTMEDWPAIEKAWEEFLIDRDASTKAAVSSLQESGPTKKSDGGERG